MRTKAERKKPKLQRSLVLATHICFVAVSPGSRSATAAGFSPRAGHGGGGQGPAAGVEMVLLSACPVWERDGEEMQARRKKVPAREGEPRKAGGEEDGMLVKSWKCAGKM